MGFSSEQVATTGLISSGFGAVSGMVGSYYGARLQGINNRIQAQQDQYNARSSALTLTGQADLDMISAQSQRNATLAGAEFSVLQAQVDADRAMGRAQIGTVRAAGEAAAAEYSAQADDLAAHMSELQAQSSLLRGERSEQNERMKYAVAKSSATASMGARGLDLGQGSALAVRNSMDLQSERSAIAIQQDAMLAAFGHRVQAQQATLSAAAKRSRASAAVASAALESSLTEQDAAFSTRMARINADATVALSAAGLVSASARADYQRTMGRIQVENSSVAGMVRQSMSPSPGLAAWGSLLSAAPGVARSWYAWNKEN